MKRNSANEITKAWRWEVRRGALAGALAGGLSALWHLLAAAAAGGTAWIPVKGAAYPFLGLSAVTPEFSAAAVVLGVALHVGISVGWGVLFALVAGLVPRRLVVPLGGVIGVGAWALMFHLILPLSDARGLVQALTPGDVAFAHVLYGLGLGLAYLLLDLRRASEGWEEPTLAGALRRAPSPRGRA
jgi:hypothetical protein